VYSFFFSSDLAPGFGNSQDDCQTLHTRDLDFSRNALPWSGLHNAWPDETNGH
jgi:hypothetical protein